MKTNDFRKLSFLATPIDRDSAMTSISLNSEVCQLHAREERILASFTGRLIEIAAVAEARGSCTSPTAALNAMRLPAIAIDQHGFIADVNAAANGIFDHDIKRFCCKFAGGVRSTRCLQ